MRKVNKMLKSTTTKFSAWLVAHKIKIQPKNKEFTAIDHYTLVYIVKNGKVLLIKKNHGIFNQQWIGLGGGVFSNENPLDGAIREAKEESGLTISDIQEKGIFIWKNGCEYSMIHVYVSKKCSGKYKVKCSEGSLSWKEISSLNSINLAIHQKHFLPKMLTNTTPYFTMVLEE